MIRCFSLERPRHAPNGKALTLVIVEQNPLAAQLLTQDAVFLTAVVDDLPLPLIEPTGNERGKDLEKRVPGATTPTSGR